MKRTHLLLLLGAAILLVLNGLIVQKELFLERGESIYLELEPVDPRSLIQGDYMTLRYAAGREIDERKPDDARRGTAVVSLDDRGVAHFERLDRGELDDDERLIRWKTKKRAITIGADAFYFQEGRADHFAQAEYAELKLDEDGSTLLVGLRDEELDPL